MSHVVGDEVSPAQSFAGYLLIGAIIIWAAASVIWLHSHANFSGNTLINALISLVIAAVYFVVSFVNGTPQSPFGYWFNEWLDRGGGLPWVSNVVSITLTLGVVTSLIWFPAPWVFWPVLGVCAVLGVPFCSNIMCRYD